MVHDAGAEVLLELRQNVRCEERLRPAAIKREDLKSVSFGTVRVLDPSRSIEASSPDAFLSLCHKVTVGVAPDSSVGASGSVTRSRRACSQQVNAADSVRVTAWWAGSGCFGHAGSPGRRRGKTPTCDNTTVLSPFCLHASGIRGT